MNFTFKKPDGSKVDIEASSIEGAKKKFDAKYGVKETKKDKKKAE